MKEDLYKTCLECNGHGSVSVMEKVYVNEPHEAPIGSATCENCSGTGNEQNEQLVLERMLDSLTPEDETKLQNHLINNVKEFGGVVITKDNCEDIFENWLGQLNFQTIISLIK